MLKLRHSWVLRYSIAVFVTFVALVLTRSLWYYIQPALYPFLLAAVMLSSWFGGLGPGLVSTVLGAGLGKYFFLIPPGAGETNWAHLGRISYFISVAVLICTLNARLRYVQRSVEVAFQREQMARQDAEAANRAKDEFLAVLSHELRTPLTAITGWVGMLRSGKLDENRTTVALETIERNSVLQLQLVEDLLDISRIVRGDLWLDSQPVNLVEVIQDATEVVQPQIEEKQLQFTLKINSIARKDLDQRIDQPEPTSMLVLGDAERLQQIILNLLSNAIKFTPEFGRIEVSLTTVNQSLKNYRTERDFDPSVQLQIKDTGIGIPSDFLPHVFDRFRQADSTNTRSYKGLGLGLAIARYLVERQGGTIQAESLGADQGATFTVKFPLWVPQDESHASLPSPLNEPSDLRLSGLSVLVVDDELDTQIWLKNVFELRQFQAIAVGSVDDAIAQFTHFSPDIVISDIAMPVKDGYALMSELKQYERQSGRSIPAIAVTAHASSDDIQKSLQAGFRQHLAKPINADDLVAAVVKLLEQHHPTRGGRCEDFDG